MVMNYSDIKRGVKIPNEETKELSEFFGILTGDGYVGRCKNNYVIEVAGNKIKDKEYLENYVYNLFFALFRIKPKLYYRKDQSTMYLRVHSKAILEFIENKGFEKGLKKKAIIPLWIKDNKLFLIYFVKGLFDTDGCICLKKKEGKLYPTMNIGSKSDILLLKIKEFLIEQEISSYFATINYDNERYKTKFKGYQIQINGYKNIISWFDKIGSNKKRNILKYQEMINLRELKKL